MNSFFKKFGVLLLAIVLLFNVTACKKSADVGSGSTDYDIVYRDETGDNTDSDGKVNSDKNDKDDKDNSSSKNDSDKKPSKKDDGEIIIDATQTEIVSKPSGGNSSTDDTDSRFDGLEEKFIGKNTTISIYENGTYGFNWNVDMIPQKPVIQICEGSKFDTKAAKSYAGTAQSAGDYYYVKANIPDLRSGKTYSYRCYDEDVKVGSQAYTFTAKNMKTTTFKFMHISDSQVDGTLDKTGDFLNNVFKGIDKNGFKPDLIVHTGDFVQRGEAAYWDNMIGANQNYLATIPIQSIAGNHDVAPYGGSDETFEHFNYKLPKQTTSNGIYYSYVYGNTKFIMLNGNDTSNNKLSDAQYNWLVSELKNKTQKWTIIGMHQPVYSVGKWGAVDLAKGFQEQLRDLFAEYKVDLVLQGHDHAYSKTYPIGKGGAIDKSYSTITQNGVKYARNPNGVIYAMNGPAGNQSRGPTHGGAEYEFSATGQVSSWAQIEVTSTRLTVKVYCYNDGTPKLWQAYGIQK